MTCWAGVAEPSLTPSLPRRQTVASWTPMMSGLLFAISLASALARVGKSLRATVWNRWAAACSNASRLGAAASGIRSAPRYTLRVMTLRSCFFADAAAGSATKALSATRSAASVRRGQVCGMRASVSERVLRGDWLERVGSVGGADRVLEQRVFGRAQLGVLVEQRAG